MSSHTGMDQEAKNKFSEKSTTIPVLYALSFLFFSVTENVNILFWLLTIKGWSLLKKGEKRGEGKSLRGKKASIQTLHSSKNINSLDLFAIFLNNKLSSL